MGALIMIGLIVAAMIVENGLLEIARSIRNCGSKKAG